MTLGFRRTWSLFSITSPKHYSPSKVQYPGCQQYCREKSCLGDKTRLEYDCDFLLTSKNYTFAKMAFGNPEDLWPCNSGSPLLWNKQTRQAEIRAFRAAPVHTHPYTSVCTDVRCDSSAQFLPKYVSSAPVNPLIQNGWFSISVRMTALWPDPDLSHTIFPVIPVMSQWCPKFCLFLLLEVQGHLAKGQRMLAGDGMSQVTKNLLDLTQRRNFYAGDLLSSVEILRNVTETFKRASYEPSSDDVQVSQRRRK